MYKHNSLFVWIVFLGLITSLASCVRDEEIKIGQVLNCDCELLNEKGDKFVGSGVDKNLFNAGRHQTKLFALSGQYSVLTSPKSRFALGHTISNTEADWYFRISVWRKSKRGGGYLVAAAKNADLLYVASNKLIEKGSDGWERLEIEMFTPLGFAGKEINIYVWNNTNDTVFFDDLKIERLAGKVYPEYPLTALAIIVDTSGFIKIQEKRKQAFRNGILQTSDNDWVKGIIGNGSKLMEAKLRLKGDWLDHLNGEKWSFRIKLKKAYSWNGMRTFSVQTPAARGYLYEWVAHKFYDDQDILTSRYGFIPITFNGKSRGLYAWEEHFEKYLLESSQRREGPILKFAEETFWEATLVNSKVEHKQLLAVYDAAIIEAFKQGKTNKDATLFPQFLNAQKLMQQYKDGSKPVSDIFDVNQLVKFYAMLDLTHANHSRAWHNQRLYFNPIICKLEPIAYDGFGELYKPYYGINGNYTYRILKSRKLNENEYDLMTFFFRDSLFIEKYIHHLKKYSSEDYLESVFSRIDNDIYFYDSIMKLEFPYYSYDKLWLQKSASDIRDYLPQLEVFLHEYRLNKDFKLIDETLDYVDVEVFGNTPEHFVNAYSVRGEKDSLIVNVFNYYPNQIIVLGTGKKNKYVEFFEHPEHIIKPFRGEGQKLTFATDTSSNYLFFMVNGSNETFKIEINKWPLPEGITAQQELMGLVNLEDSNVFEMVSNAEIHIKRGNLIINHPIIIPGGYTVIFRAGTTIDLVDNAMIISYSPVIMKGTKVSPITITSSDFSANGFTVLQAAQRSKLENVVFENLGNLDYNGWTITGAVTFYKSDVDIVNTRFYRNKCEDALNIIRSDFRVESSTFDNIFSDAFDSDFSTGLVTATHFTDIGNDAIDFSGSDIIIETTSIVNAKDKGISGGEHSFLKVIGVSISNSNIGIASKDLSVVEIEDSKITDCNYGLVLLQKKPEYGPAKIVLNNTKIINPKEKFLIEKGSLIELDGKKIKGKVKNVADLFY